MIVERIQIESFGRWKHQTWELGRGSTLFYGENEAGKSTILSFIESVLFGFQTDPSTRSGGSLLIRKDGVQWYIERRQGRTKSGELRVTKNGRPSDREELLDGLTKTGFRRLYRMDLDQLQNMEDIPEDELNHLLIDTSFTAAAPLLEEDRRASQQAQALYNPRGRKTEVHQLLEQIQQLEKQRRTKERELDDYRHVRDRLEEAENDIDQLQHEVREVEKSEKQEEKLSKLKEPVLRLEALKEMGLREPSLPPQTEEKVQHLEKQLQDLEEELKKIQAAEPPVTEDPSSNLQAVDAVLEEGSEAVTKEQELDYFEEKRNALQMEKERVRETIPEDVPVSMELTPAQKEKWERLLEQEESNYFNEREQPASVPKLSRTGMAVFFLPFLLSAVLLYQQQLTAFFFLLITGLAMIPFRRRLFSSGIEAGVQRPDWVRWRADLDEWAADMGLPPGKTTASYRDILYQSSRLQEIEEELQRVQEKANKLERTLSAFYARAESLLPEQSHTTASGWVRLLQKEQKRLHAELRQWEEKQWVESRTAQVKQKLEQLTEERENWFRKAGVSNWASFWEKAAASRQDRERWEEAVLLEQQMAAVVPDKEEREQLRAVLADGNEEKTEETETRDALFAKRDKLLEEKAGLLRRLEGLERDGTYEELSRKYTHLQEELKSRMRRWAVLRAEQEMTARIRLTYEQDRQPKVLEDASERFRRMTDGVYQRLLLEPGSSAITAEREDGAVFTAGSLSRGTKELLYTAFRMAAAGYSRPFPLLLDEAMVNMDRRRRDALWKELSQYPLQQVFFTCHEHLAQEWEAHMDGRMYTL
ncbi:AAA family ATPase [Alkalicoccus urumqiensis]|uniref:YhaN AAA domain-containing protein n=1 Tax=Alkalicoccus urumqiensis TaxID=1548213 RepID=A0A2P6MFC2_ALKUR|nr:AAA family ATPase [Alkalicoccus urumqiensis]PRO64978.1 hypothetical protein C6I21_11030 [Alkalicoccus urumqiensis]